MPFIGPYLSDCGATDNKITIGLLFLGLAISYTISSILFGYLVGQFRCARSLMFWGAFLSAGSYLFLGPTPWLKDYFGINLPCSIYVSGAAMIGLGSFLS